MSSKKITQLPEATVVDGSEIVPFVQNGLTKKATLNTITSNLLQGPQGIPGQSFIWRSQWSVSESYQVNDVVFYQGNSYICIQNNTSIIPQSNSFWNLIAQRGVDGADGLNGLDGRDGTDGESVTWKSQWVSGDTYIADDIVEFGGSAFIATGTILPGEIPGISGEWELMVSRGVDGIDGIDGVGVPSGGVTGQYLVKTSSTDYDTSWSTLMIAGPVYIASGNYAPNGADNFIIVNRSSGAPTTITLPSSPPVGKTYIIKDGRGDAATNNITVNGNGKNIDGAASFVININYGSLSLVYNGTQWNNWSQPARPVIAAVG
jgi:hypothetical protein